MSPEPARLANALTNEQAQRAAVVFEALARGLSLDDAERIATFVVDGPVEVYDEQPEPDLDLPQPVLEPAYEETVAATAPLLDPPGSPTRVDSTTLRQGVSGLQITRIPGSKPPFPS